MSDNQREHEPVDDRKKKPAFARKKKAPAAVVTHKARSFSDSTAASALALTPKAPEAASAKLEQAEPKATPVKKDVKAKNRRTAHDRGAFYAVLLLLLLRLDTYSRVCQQ